MEEIAFCIGNGKSRQPFDLEKLRNKGTIIGCNALYRDFVPDVLIAIDAGMIYEIIDSGFVQDHPECHYIVPRNRTIKRGKGPIYRIEPASAFNSSGALALQYAGMCGFNKVYMLGYDCYTGNIYESTFNYSKKKVSRFDTFIRVYDSSINVCKKTEFINVTRDNRDGISASIKQPNYKGAIDYKEFEELLDNLEEREIKRIHSHCTLDQRHRVVKNLQTQD